MREKRFTIENPSNWDVPVQARFAGAWIVSLAIHLVVLLLIALISTEATQRLPTLLVTSFIPDPVVEKLISDPPEFHAELTLREDIGASALGGLESDGSSAANLIENPLPPVLTEREMQDAGQIEYREFVQAVTGTPTDLSKSIRGVAGFGVTGAEGAVDQITQEILLSIEERPTLVIWFFDRSGSLTSQREAIRERFHRIYEELGVAEKAGAIADRRLLAGVVTFGQDVQFPVDRPTSDVAQLEGALKSIVMDESGEEHVFTAIQMAVQRFRRFATTPKRNVMFVVFSDEAGNDQDQLDSTVDLLRRLAIPVYVVGVPAPFGRKETLIKYVDPDPDPQYDHSPQWAVVEQGPESLVPETLKIYFNDSEEAESPIDSGYGPFALTRLCYETGGIYFTVHPNRNTEGKIRRGETTTYSAYLQSFFDPAVMRRYRPDYVSAKEYHRLVKSSRLRSSLVQAAEMSWFSTLDNPKQRFLFRDEASFAQELNEAQKDAARLEPYVVQLYELLAQGEADRNRETTPRWQAGYDLAMGRVLAVKVRTETYNVMLAQAKQGLKFQSSGNNTWQLVAADEVTAGSRYERDAARAREYLQRVVREHPNTPWALLANKELKEPLSWQWKEEFTPVDPPASAVATNANTPAPPPTDEQRRMLERPLKKRPLPKL